jgi:hypothetical protein
VPGAWVPVPPSKKAGFTLGGFPWPYRGVCVVGRASELQVVKLVGSTVSEWDPMVNLQAIDSAADHAGPVALVDEGSEPAPRPA